MAHNVTVWGVRIYLDRSLQENTDLGLYTDSVGAMSELRWVESEVTMTDITPATWAHGVISEIGEISQSVDLRRGGARGQLAGVDIKLVHTSRLLLELATLGVSLSGCTCEIYEISGIDYATLPTVNCIYTGVIDDQGWTETSLTIPVRTAVYKRRAQMLTTVNNAADGNYPNAPESSNGVIIPASFGDAPMRKLINTTKTERVLSNTDIYPSSTPAGLAQFPITSMQTVATLTYFTQIGLAGAGLPLGETLVGKYVRVVAGSKSVGEMRRIASVVNFGYFQGFSFTLDAYFTETLIGSIDAKATGNAWIEIVSIDGRYECDVWPCRSFVDSAGNEIDNAVELFAFSDDKKVDITAIGDSVTVQEKPSQYFPLPAYIYDRSDDGDNNAVDLDVKQFTRSPDRADAYKMIPVVKTDVSLITTLATFNEYIAGYSKVDDGLYFDSGEGISVSATPNHSSPLDFSEMCDKTHSTYTTLEWAIRYTYGGSTPISTHWMTAAIEIKLPEAPTDFDFDSAFLLIDAAHTMTPQTSVPPNLSPINGGYYIKVYTRKFMGSASEVINKEKIGTGTSGTTTFEASDTPDFYYTDTPDYKNKKFYVEESVESLTAATLTGKLAFQLPGVTKKSEYDGVYRIIVAIGRKVLPIASPSDAVHNFKFREIGVMFHKSASIKDAIYSPHRGRVFNSTWGSRRTSSAMIADPIDMIEHGLRLQNWSETGDNVEWGKAYSPNAKINTGSVPGSGRFDEMTGAGGSDVSLWSPRDLRPAFQFDSDGYTDTFIRGLVQDTFTLQYQDWYGRESIDFLFRTSVGEGESDVVTLADIVGVVSQITEPRQQDVFCEPTIRYNYDYGSKKFLGLMEVKNTNDPGGAGWVASYTPGFTGTGNLQPGTPDGEVVWTIASELYQRFRQVEQPPREMTDKIRLTRYEDALWYVYRWLLWQGKRRTGFSVSYDRGKLWRLGSHLYLNLPHQTAGKDTRILVENISLSRSMNRVTVGVVLMDEVTLA